MKRLIFILLSCAFVSVSFSQPFPINSTIGTQKSTVLTKGIHATDSAFWLRTNFPDTGTANLGGIDEIPGSIIRVGDKVYMRSYNATKWVELTGGSDTSAGGFWGLTGNTGTNNNTNFLGTIDSVPFSIRVHNKRVMYLSPTYTGINLEGRGNASDIMIGHAAGGPINPTPYENVMKGVIAIGDSALGRFTKSSPSGWPLSGIVAIGNNALSHGVYPGTQGSTAVGDYALRYSVSGFRNTAVGQSAGRNNVSGTHSVYVGIFAGESASSKGGQTFVGGEAGRAGGGESDVFIGNWSGYFSGGSIIGATITNGGSGYTTATVTFSPNPNIPEGYNHGVTATGTAIIIGGSIAGVTMTNIGRCYSSYYTPTVTITGDGTGATAIPIVDFSQGNTFAGGQSAAWNLVGKFNTVLGYKSGSDYNGILRDTLLTLVGAYAGRDSLLSSSEIIKNSAAIGNHAKVGKSNALVLGAPSTDLAHTVDVGIGTTRPTSKLHIVSSGNGFKLADGSEGSGKVLTSDANGGASWADLPSSTNYADSLRRSGLAVQMRKGGVWTNQFDLPDSGGGGIAIGSTTMTSSVTGSIPYDSSGTVSRNDAFYWDVTNKRLGVGTKAPQTALDINGAINLATGSTNGIKFGNTVRMYDDGSKIRFSPTGGILQIFTPSSNADVQIYNSGGDSYINIKPISGVSSTIETAGSATHLRTQTTDANFFMIGSGTPSSKLDVVGSLGSAITTITTNTTLDATHHTVIVTSGTPTITLPSASGVTRREYRIVNQTGSAVTISTYKDFAGADATTIAANSAAVYQSNGTNWYRVQ